jgi:hypothetical protein
LSFDGELVGRGEAGDAGPDDDGIAGLVTIQPTCVRRDFDLHPERAGAFVEGGCHWDYSNIDKGNDLLADVRLIRSGKDRSLTIDFGWHRR